PGPGSDNPAAIGPGGIVHCSLPDWAKYVGLHLEAEQGRCVYLKHDTFVKLHTPGKGTDNEQYAMGWSVATRPWAGTKDKPGRVLTHNGTNTMWFAVTWVAPERDFAVLIACNQGGDKAAKACDQAAWALIQDHLAHEKEDLLFPGGEWIEDR